MRKVRENILVASGDQALFPAGAIFADDGTVLVGDGQIVFWDPETNLSVGGLPGGITTNRVVISVGTGMNSLRSNFGEYMYFNDIQEIRSQAPNCGTAEIWDLLFSGVECGSDYGVNVTVEDNETQNQYPYNRPATYTYSVSTDDCACESCDGGVDSMLLACKLRDAINGTAWNSKAPDERSVYNHLKMGENLPFEATVLYAEAESVYCISTVAGTCDDCIEVDTLFGTISLDNGLTETAFTNVNNAGGTAGLTARLNHLVDQINTVLDGNGTAIITGGPGDCCDYQLRINSCYGTDIIMYEDNILGATVIPKCAEAVVSKTITNPLACKNCGAGTVDTTYAAGIRFIAKKVEYDCGCYPPNPPKGALYRKLNVHPINGFDCAAHHVRQVAATVMPDNQGYLWQWREFASDNGGRGRAHDPFVRSGYGPIGLPLDRGREGATKVVCQTDYCSYTIEHRIPNNDTGVHGNMTHAVGRTVILIPSADTVTLAAFELALIDMQTDVITSPVTVDISDCSQI